MTGFRLPAIETPRFAWIATRVFAPAGRWLERRELDLIAVAQSALATLMFWASLIYLALVVRGVM